MIRLTALNDSSSKSSEEDHNYIKEPPQEVQEENVLKLYNEALLEQKNGNIKKAEEMYCQLLSSNLLKSVKPDEEIKIKKSDSICPLYSKPSLMVKYSCLKNLALLSQKMELFNEALDYFIQALDVEGSDITVWFQCGCVALKLNSVNVALECFLKGLELSPKHWPSLDKSIMCLYILNDYVSCLYFISRAFAIDAHYTRGHVLRDHIFSNQPSLQVDIKHFYPKIELYADKKCEANEQIKSKLLNEVLDMYDRYCKHSKDQNFVEEINNFVPSKKIDSSTWVSLGEYILDVYNEMETSKQNISFLTPINFKKILVEEKSSVNGNETDASSNKELTENVCASKLSDTENNKELNAGSSEKKNKKHRGSALMEELLWSGKRRSARVRSSLRGNPEPLDVAEALRRILPRKLLFKTKQLKIENSAKECLIEEGSMDTMDLYRLFEKQESAAEKRVKEEQERNEVEQDIDKIVESEGYFGKKDEENDVLTFIESQNNNNIIDIVTSFVMTLKNHWKKAWPTSLPNIYIKCYELMRKHHPIDFEICSTEAKFKTLVEESGSVLLYGELYLENQNSSRSKNFNESKAPTNLPIIFLQNLMELSDRQEMFETAGNYFEFLLRLYWLRCRIFLEKSETNLAIAALNNVLACYELFPEFESTVLHFKNCRKHNIISKPFTEEFLAYQSRKKSLAEVVRLYEDESYLELTEILKETFTTAPNTVSTYFKEQESELVDRQTQLSMLINGLYHLNEYKECIFWLETCCYEILQKSLVQYPPGKEEGESWMITLDRFLVAIEDCLQLGNTTVTEALPQNKVSRFVQTLCHAICKELEDSDRPPCPARPWIMLNTILIGLESQEKPSSAAEEEEEDENDIPSSVLILFTAHEYLGRREWCNCNESILLFLIMDQVIPHIRNPEWSSFRETVQQHVEQAIYCLYAHPNKKTKARYLMDHNVNSITLTWKRGIQLFDLFRPDEIPSYDSLRINLIGSETELLFRKIASLIPDDKNPTQISDRMNEFITGKKNEVPDTCIDLPEAVKDLFYILGDYYFKTHEFAKAVKYLLMDLCANPERVDSWASMALSKASLLEQQLNSCDPLKDEVFQQDALSALRCYEHCLQLDNKQCALWIEYGSFVYTIHSFCSQRMKLESHSLSLEQFEELESTKNKMLETAKQAFINANLIWYEVKEESERQDERWLHHYMLGKICEKNGDLSYFNHYEKAAELLYENKAEFPSKVGYTAPQTLAIEALEVYYRVHVCVIKNLELNEGKHLDAKTRHLFNKHLNLCSKGAFAKQISKEDLAKMKAKKLEAAQQEKNMKEIKGILSDIITKIESMHEKEIKTVKLKEKTTNDLTVPEPNKEPDKIKFKDINEKQNGEKDGNDENLEETDSEIKIIEEKAPKKELEVEEKMHSIEDEQKKPPKVIEIEDSPVVMEVQADHRKSVVDWNRPSDDYFITLKDLNNMKHVSSKAKKRRRASQASISSTSCASEEIHYDDDSSSSSSSSESSASSQTSSSSSSESSQGQSDTNREPSKITDDDEKQSDKEKYDKSPKSEREEKEDESKSLDSESNLLIRCLKAFETCALRFPQHYKSVYRLAHFYFRSKEHRDIGKCRDLLLGRYQTRYQSTNGFISGLFAERKTTNFFNGIWRIPAGDVDRPGSFASHMSRSVLLLMEVLRDLKDHKMLLDICLQLKKTPDSDKKYLRESERNQLSVQACNLTIQTLRKNVKDSSVMTLPIVLDCYRCYQKIQKHYSHKESSFGDVLLEAFKRLGKGDNCTLDQALKFCQSEVSAARIKIPKGLNSPQSLTPKLKSLKLKKQEKKKTTPKPQISAKALQKSAKPYKCGESKKKQPYNVIQTNLLPDSSYWSTIAKSLSELKSNTTGTQMYADLLRTAALSAQQKEETEKKVSDQIGLKSAYDKLKSDLNQKISQDSCKFNPMFFPFMNYPVEYGNDKDKQILNAYWGTGTSFSGPVSENSFQNIKKNKLVKPRSVLKSSLPKSDSVKLEEAKQTKTNFTIDDILSKPSLPVKGQSSSSSSLTKSIEEKIKRISKEVNITKCSSSQAMNLSTIRKNVVETGKRSYQESSSDVGGGGGATIKKICQRPEQPTSSKAADDIEVVVIDD